MNIFDTFVTIVSSTQKKPLITPTTTQTTRWTWKHSNVLELHANHLKMQCCIYQKVIQHQSKERSCWPVDAVISHLGLYDLLLFSGLYVNVLSRWQLWVVWSVLKIWLPCNAKHWLWKELNWIFKSLQDIQPTMITVIDFWMNKLQ